VVVDQSSSYPPTSSYILSTSPYTATTREKGSKQKKTRKNRGTATREKGSKQDEMG